MKIPLFVFAAILLTLLPGAQSQDPPPAAQRAETGSDDTPVPSWVPPAPVCDEDQGPDDGPAMGEPASTISTEGGTAAPQVVVEPSDGNDRLAFDYDSSAGTVEFDYRSPDATDHRMRIDFEWLHEFLDTDGDGQLDDGEPVLQSKHIGGAILHYARTWEAKCGVRLQWVYLLTIDAQDIAGMEPEEQAAFLEDKPRLTLRFTHVAAEGEGFSPDRVKIDIGIDSYDYASADSVLAFTTLVASDENQAAAPADESVVSSAGGTTVVYNWLPTAEADGETVQVHAETSAAGEGTNVTFVYPHAASILHDPELGLQRVVRLLLGQADLDRRALGVGIAVGAVVLLGIGFGRRRWP